MHTIPIRILRLGPVRDVVITSAVVNYFIKLNIIIMGGVLMSTMCLKWCKSSIYRLVYVSLGATGP
jgi:hypothetical protein